MYLILKMESETCIVEAKVSAPHIVLNKRDDSCVHFGKFYCHISTILKYPSLQQPLGSFYA